MSAYPTIRFAEIARPTAGSLVLLCNDTRALGATGNALDEEAGGLLKRAMELAKFKGKRAGTVEVLAPANLPFDRIVIAGLGGGELEEAEWTSLGGSIYGALPKGCGTVTVLAECPEKTAFDDRSAARLAMGMMLRAYAFDRYKSKKKDDNGESDAARPDITIGVSDPASASVAWEAARAVGEGVILARELVNEPANVLGPVEFAEKAAALSELGVEVEVLEEAEMAALGMNALLGVAQGSERPARMAIMRWQGGAADAQPVAIVGKGVVFDTGGISIKPAASMEDMKGDMGGAACVVGLMHALAARKAKANVVGVIGLVENMPDGNAQRPGDIVTSMAGQTIEIINTDAEGRLVLADALHYTIDRFKPRFVVDLATLTGAVIIALGHTNAGLFTNDDRLADEFSKAGIATGDTVWRLPVGPDYDKLIDSKFADMKNTGGRAAGSITAAQFLKRFVGETPWVHLDIAGTGFGAPANEISRTFGSGFGVQLIDRVIADHYEG